MPAATPTPTPSTVDVRQLTAQVQREADRRRNANWRRCKQPGFFTQARVDDFRDERLPSKFRRCSNSQLAADYIFKSDVKKYEQVIKNQGANSEHSNYSCGATF